MSDYTKHGPFANGSAPGISAEFLNPLETAVEAAHDELHAHEALVNNPHAVTSAQVGAASAADLTAHKDATAVHAATNLATADRLVIRDASGRARFASPSGSGDAANKAYVDGKFDLSTGHDHDGSDSRQISYANLLNKPKDRNTVRLAVAGDMAVADDVLDWDIYQSQEPGTLVKIHANVKEAPSGVGSVLTFRVKLGGTTLHTMSIQAGAVVAIATSGFAATALTEDARYQLDITAIGSTTPGAWLVVDLIYEKEL